MNKYLLILGKNMLIVGNTLVSDEIAQCYFCCNLQVCNGKCCVEGDAGAPLEEEEIQLIAKNLHEIKKFMTPDAISEVIKTGVFVTDPEGKKVTPLLSGRECVFVCYDKDIAFCAIEKAYSEKKITFQKPVSCHLYPVRVTDYDDFLAVNYHNWHVCKSAICKGKENKILLYKYLKAALIKKFGKEWYDELTKIAEYLAKKKSGL
ncbi:MAG: DUF3109 family protein [Bacteroidales bacterium]|jgi:hypothetical protein|nr:DUF3109 family protein [Bacteroidales bacterium]MDD4213255.1 DUF3109 family protein [Bacteroidales bacterium]